ncbi:MULTISPECIES: hypothetical protein [Komagataeibacter]|uniref:Uncharacterized protein n=1 Tax=Komagataeibacter oboediens TaxID=65958 RepID=A0A318QRV5_9PROT|nr:MULTISPECIES: hypothetical protein [Komagataeibacter]PYD80071.1 hypothetical protein CFR80_14245 [Komagataeibacter oboediens]
MLTRETDWRQGDLLTHETAGKLTTLNIAVDGSQRIVVITHDCDLPNDSETSVEVIVADVVSAPDAQFSYAKNPRKLHLCYEVTGGQTLAVELRHAERCIVPKGEFEKHAARDDQASLPIDGKRTLKQWLAARYGRPAFPNAFESRLRKEVGRKKTVERQIGKILESNAKHLVGLFFDLGEQRSAEVPEGEPYALSISVVYDATEGGPQARHAAEEVAVQLGTLFKQAYGEPDTATDIAIDACEAIADTSITLADLRRVDQWRLEYISLNDRDHGNFLPVGETPA